MRGNITEGDSLYLVSGTFSGSFATSWFNDFGGWEAGNGAYTLTTHAPALHPFAASNGDTLTFTLNTAGIAAVNKTGNTVFMLTTEGDRTNTEPTANETVAFDDNAPYIQITFTPSALDISGIESVVEFSGIEYTEISGISP